jgi:transposase
MSNAPGCAAGAPATDPCPRCDVLLGLTDVHVIAVERHERRLRVTVQSPWQLMGCPDCGVIALSTGRRTRVLHDVPGTVPVTPDGGNAVGRARTRGVRAGRSVNSSPPWSLRAGR